MLLVRFTFAAVCISVFLIFTVYIRTENPRLFYQCRKSKVKKESIERDLRMMKIEIESFKNPVEINTILQQQENDGEDD